MPDSAHKPARTTRSSQPANASAKFIKLLTKVERIKQDIETAHTQIASARVFMQEEAHPLLDKLDELQEKIIFRLHELFGTGQLDKRERRVVAFMIQQYASELLSTGDASDELRQIHDFYAPMDWQTQQRQGNQEQLDRLNEMAESLGLNIRFDETDTEETIREKMMQQEEATRAEEQAREERRAQRKKTRKQLEKEAIEQQANQDVRKTVKEIYNNLVKLMHPDLEQDPEERIRKNEIIKQINLAYEADDMFTLLQLQSVYLNQHSEHIAQLPDAQLEVFINILQRQKDELEQKLMMICVADPATSEIFSQLCSLAGERPTRQKRKMFLADITEQIQIKQRNLNLTQTLETLRTGIELLEVMDTPFGPQLVEALYQPKATPKGRSAGRSKKNKK